MRYGTATSSYSLPSFVHSAPFRSLKLLISLDLRSVKLHKTGGGGGVLLGCE
jgi:hypothetical protein